jgi:hypothetical protein
MDPGGRARFDALRHILNALDGGNSLTLGDLYRSNRKDSWTEFIKDVNGLITEGLLEGTGDGFVVLYSLTEKGRRTTGRT